MKKLLRFVLVVLIFGILIFIFREELDDFLYQKFVLDGVEISTLSPNEYYRENDYSYVQITKDFYIKDRQHLLNAYYTIINSGQDEFTFMCDRDYVNCIKDVDEISSSQSELSNINSFVHPYNSFDTVETSYDSFGKVILKINKIYSPEEIVIINNKINEIVNSKLSNTSDKRAIIKLVHDYIINNTKYDSNRSENNVISYKSDTAYGSLIEGVALCGGYTDAMALFLDYYNIPNFKVISENHTWNALYLNDEWVHLDLTWDDPVSKIGKDYLEYSFFLINTEGVYSLETGEHAFDLNVFEELK